MIVLTCVLQLAGGQHGLRRAGCSHAWWEKLASARLRGVCSGPPHTGTLITWKL